MSKNSRANAAAKAMTDAALDASLIIQACENKYRLKHEEALDVLCAAVCDFVSRDGDPSPEHFSPRLLEFVGALDEYVRDVFGFNILEYAGDDSNTQA